MKLKRFTAVMLAAILLGLTLSSGAYAFALVTCETQFAYDSADPSWLKDLTVKEDMNTINGLSGRNTLQPVSSYPYRETAESFKEEIAYYEVLYTLDEDMANAAYLYILSLAESFSSSSVAADQSDEFIRSYLESLGIVYPTGHNADSVETRTVARALYAIIAADDSYTVKRGTGLYDAFTSYLSKIVGVNNNVLIKFDGDNDLTDLREYVLAVCRYMLYAAGYKVDKNTPESEVYRLIAVMTIRAQGISIDSSSATFEEIKNKYLCAMMCKIYDVPIDTAAFDAAVKKGNLEFYMLQLIGKKYKITVRDSLAYEEAFSLVCKNTPYFDLEEGEFYADIYEYTIPLKYRRDTIWIYPQTLSVTSESEGIAVTVLINGEKVRENYYADVALDSSKDKNEVVITVEYKVTGSSTKTSTYKLNILQGKEKPVEGPTVSTALAGIGALVSQVVEDMGNNPTISNIVAGMPFETPERFWSIASLMLPNFISGSLPGTGLLQRIFSYSKNDPSRVDTDKLGGVAGLDSYNSSSNSSQSLNFSTITVPNGNLNITVPETPSSDANQIVVGDGNNAPPVGSEGGKNGNWFKELISDTKSVVVVVAALVVAFTVCLVLFSKLLKGRDGKKGKKR